MGKVELSSEGTTLNIRRSSMSLDSEVLLRKCRKKVQAHNKLSIFIGKGIDRFDTCSSKSGRMRNGIKRKSVKKCMSLNILVRIMIWYEIQG